MEKDTIKDKLTHLPPRYFVELGKCLFGKFDKVHGIYLHKLEELGLVETYYETLPGRGNPDRKLKIIEPETILSAWTVEYRNRCELDSDFEQRWADHFDQSVVRRVKS